MIYNSLSQLIGNTPLLEVEVEGAVARVLLKLESFNPGGSAKDRVALMMITEAEKNGQLRSGGTIIEATSGNTGVGLAWVGRSRGYNVILTMPENMSEERKGLLRAYGAELVLTPAAEGISGAVNKALELQKEIPGSIIPDQFSNPANPLAHELTTGEEIWDDTEGCVDILVCAAGTAGTLCGTSRALKKHNSAIRTVAVEPAESPLLSEGWSGRHIIQGIGANFIPDNYDSSVVDEIMAVKGEQACEATRQLARRGILCGISSGAVFCATAKLARMPENEGFTIVAIMPDTGERYLSAGIF